MASHGGGRLNRIGVATGAGKDTPRALQDILLATETLGARSKTTTMLLPLLQVEFSIQREMPMKKERYA